MSEEKSLPQNPAVFTAATIPALYSNNVLVSMSLADITLTVTINGQPTHQLIMPLGTARTLVSNLSKALDTYEQKTGNKILGLQETSDFFSKK